MSGTTTTVCADERDLYSDVKYCRGKKSLPGTRSYMFMTKKSNVVTWPVKNSSPVSLSEVATLKNDFVLAADKKWAKVELVPNQNQVVAEQVGQWGSYMFKNTYTAVLPGTEEEATGLAAEVNNDNCIFLVPQRNGKLRLLGNEEFDCTVKPGLDSGKSSDDSNATTLTIEVEDEIAAPFYPGKIETSEGDISGADGSLLTDSESSTE